jgi:hypothetical protein
MAESRQEKRRIAGYNHFRIFYGYPWQSDFFPRKTLKRLMSNVQARCREFLKKEGHFDVVVDIADLELTGGECDYLPPELRRRIGEASAGIFEISDRNPNVLYELGHMHGAGKRVLVIRQKDTQIAADLEGIVEIRYEKSKLLAIERKLTAAVCKVIEDVRKEFRWETFLLEGTHGAPTRVHLGWTVPEYLAPSGREKARPGRVRESAGVQPRAGYLSPGDVLVMDLLRQRLASVDQSLVKLETDVREVAGRQLSANIISIGGPRRNLCTAAILNHPDISGRANYRFVEREPDADGFIEYFIQSTRGKHEEYHTRLRLQDPELRRYRNGEDFGLIYKVTPVGEPEYTWIILAGITRQSTLACLHCLFGNKKVQESIITHSLNGQDTEVLIKADVINGDTRDNPKVIAIHALEREPGRASSRPGASAVTREPAAPHRRTRR